MILFWLICALFIIIAFAFVLPTALERPGKSQRATADERKLANIAIYRDQLSELEADLRNGIVSQEQYPQDRDEIERRLLEDTAGASSTTSKGAKVPPASRSTAYAIAFGLPLAAVIFYFQVGNPESITQTPRPVAVPPSATGGRTQEQIEANVAALAKRLQANPNDAQGWTMLARSYNSMERFGEAAGAYAKATELQPNDADLWAEYAFATAMASNQSMDGRPMELVNQALKVDPDNAKALQLAGSAAFQAKDYAKAIDYWQRVLKQVPPDTATAQAIQERIDEAKSLAVNKAPANKQPGNK
jgi:cytochrome c-type biogenesis protein CcmH